LSGALVTAKVVHGRGLAPANFHVLMLLHMQVLTFGFEVFLAL
jgi:hypothetical protein